MVEFNESIITFAKTYVKKQNKEKSKLNTQAPYHTNLLDQIKEFKNFER